VNPQSVRGSNTGVFIGCDKSESHDAWIADGEKVTGYELTGCCRSMFANRLSYFFDFRGLYCRVFCSIRPHQMHEMQTAIIVYVGSVSVSLSVAWFLGVKTLGDPSNVVLDKSPYFHYVIRCSHHHITCSTCLLLLKNEILKIRS